MTKGALTCNDAPPLKSKKANRKVDNGGKDKNIKQKIMLFIVANNFITSPPPECQSTRTLTAHTNKWFISTPSSLRKEDKREKNWGKQTGKNGNCGH